MSLFGAMNTAISGLAAQSSSFSNIGDNLANTQTVGFKRIGTTFDDYLSVSSAEHNDSDAVMARPDYANTVQGSISQTDNPLDLAVSGQGFLSVSQTSGDVNGATTFKSQPEYTREGDFKLNQSGYLVNASGYYLNGWVADANGQLDQTKVQPLQVGQTGYSPVATSSATLAANLPATPSSANPIVTPVSVYDALGTPHDLQLTWTQNAAAANSWTLSIAQSGAAAPLGSVTVAFGAAGNAAAPEGTIGSVTGATGTLTGSAFTAGGKATVGITADFGLGSKPITLGLGTFGGTDGLTQFAGTDYKLISLAQNGVKPGSFSSVSMKSTGDVVVNYDNGQSRVVARAPVVTFANADALQRQDGQAYTETKESGQARTMQAGTNGAGGLVTNSVEGSNVDIAGEFTKLIVAQRAYSANTKMVTTADELLQQTIDMKR